jgi:hypothetical protein
MELPQQLWQEDEDCALVLQTVELFHNAALILTDGLTNSVFVSKAAEGLFGERGEALVNRAAYSLLGFGTSEKLPAPMESALLAQGPPWRGIVRLGMVENPDNPATAFCEASAIIRRDKLVCGILRLTPASPPVAP